MRRQLAHRAEHARASLLRKPFPYLAEHFFTRMFDSELVSGDGDNSMSIGGVFAILAVPGLLAPLFLFAKYSSFLAWLRGHPQLNVWQLSLSDQYVLITYAMAVTGIATVIKWDSLFPDRRDFAALAPLPLSSVRIFLAKVAALVALLLMFVLDVNGPSSLVFPMVFISGYGTLADYVRFTAVHMLTILAASCFTFLFFLAIAGLFLTLLPPRWFVRASRYVRTLAVVALLAMFLTSFAVAEDIMTGAWSRTVRLLPPVWFLGMARALFGRPARPIFHELAALATWGLLIALIVAAGAYALSYRRYFLKIPESIDAPARGYGRATAAIWQAIERLLPGLPFERACSIFALKTILRSEKHWLMLGAYVGLAITITAETLSGTLRPHESIPAPPLLAIPLVFVFFLISGLRFVFALPSELRANWVFQVCGEAPCEAGARVARLVMLVMVAPFLLLICLPIYAAVWSVPVAFAHIAFVGLLSLILADIALAGYRSIPFTCSWAPAKGNPAFTIALYTGAFFIFASMMSTIEHWMLGSPAAYGIVTALLIGAWRYWKHEAGNGAEPGTPLLYEDRRQPAVQTLNLS